MNPGMVHYTVSTGYIQDPSTRPHVSLLEKPTLMPSSVLLHLSTSLIALVLQPVLKSLLNDIFFLKQKKQAWWHTPEIPALGGTDRRS